MEKETHETIPKGLKGFINKMNQKRNNSNEKPIQCHNLYLLQTVDMDGNITGEAYGVNLMTNYGFRRTYDEGNYDHRGIYIGNGTEAPMLTNNSLYSPITTIRSTETFYGYILTVNTYDQSTGAYTGNCIVYSGYFDYNISGIEEDKEITEIGYGESTTALYTHASIYDSEGNKSSITKRVNERLTITMYWSTSFNKSLIEENWNNGVYMFMDPAWLICIGGAMNYSVNLAAEPCFRRQDYDNRNRFLKGSYYLYYNSITPRDDSTFDSNIKPGSILLENPYDYTSMFIFGDYTGSYQAGEYYQSRMFIITHDQLPEPEEIISEKVYTNNYSSEYINNAIGRDYVKRNTVYADGIIPASNFDIKSMHMYNHLTKEWDIEDTFISDPNTDYTSSFGIYGYIYTEFEGKNIEAHVYVNTFTQHPIESFSNTGIVLYASDEYWDTSTWVMISNLADIPTELQTKKYYIKTSGNATKLVANRNMVKHKICPPISKITFNDVPKNSKQDGRLTPLSSDEYGWIMTYDHIVYPNLNDGTSVQYELMGPNGYPPYRFCRWSTGDRVITLSGSNQLYLSSHTSVRIFDVTNPDVSPTYVDVELAFTSTTFSHNNYWSFSENGFLASQRTSGDNECVILDIYGNEDGPTQHLITNCRSCHILGRTDNCVYNVADSTILTFNIYDMKNQTILDTFSLPDEGYSLEGITGWKNYVYVRVGVSGNYTTFLYNMNTKTLVHLTNLNISLIDITVANIGTGAVANNGFHFLCVDECMIIGCWDHNNRGIWLFKESDLENPINISTGVYYCTHNLADGQLKYINGGRQLLLSNSYDRHIIFDIGKIIDEGPLTNVPYGRYKYRYHNVGYEGCTGFFGNGVFIIDYSGELTWYPIESYVEHKVVGTTKTIQSFNNPKRLQNKTYQWTITNDTSKWSDE